MKSTGEVMGLDHEFDRAFAKSQIACGMGVPEAGAVFISVKDADKPAMAPLGAELVRLGFTLLATRGTAAFLAREGLPVTVVNKVAEGRPHCVDAMKNGEIALVFNTTAGTQAIADSFSLRRAALLHQIPYHTTVPGCRAMVQAIAAAKRRGLEVAPLQSYRYGAPGAAEAAGPDLSSRVAESLS